MTDLAGRILKAWLAEGRDVRLGLDNLADTAADVARTEIMRLTIAIEDAIDTLEAMDLHTDNPLYARLRATLEPEA